MMATMVLCGFYSFSMDGQLFHSVMSFHFYSNSKVIISIKSIFLGNALLANFFFHLLMGSIVSIIFFVLRLISSTRNGAKVYLIIIT